MLCLSWKKTGVNFSGLCAGKCRQNNALVAASQAIEQHMAADKNE